ncbi:MAG: 50S ribosomal protein L15 [Ignavibacteria bacterium]|jgi:large subunit ribosomal protein L15|nr:50S ribosomal protein L15 [Ignavibacteria bacterium]MBK6876720.1 50S ribosomal protein L15 [Ignavibacteria bacterium]
MDILSNLKYAEGSRKKRKRVGRGQGSGHGGTSTRGHKGQHSRSGAKFRAWFEGGQMPLQRRVPKFGFRNFARTEYNILNLADIQILVDSGKFSEGKIDKELLVSSKIIRGLDKPLKILGNGELKAKLEISANAFSKAAVEKIEKGGGKAITI